MEAAIEVPMSPNFGVVFHLLLSVACLQIPYKSLCKKLIFAPKIVFHQGVVPCPRALGTVGGALSTVGMALSTVGAALASVGGKWMSRAQIKTARTAIVAPSAISVGASSFSRTPSIALTIPVVRNQAKATIVKVWARPMTAIRAKKPRELRA